MNKKIISSTVLAFFLSFNQAAFAMTSTTDSNKQCSCGERFKNMMASLNLTPEQKDKIKAIKAQARQALKGKVKEMRSIRMQINTIVRSDTVDETKLDALINQKKDMIGNFMKHRAMVKHQIYMLLNDKQKAQLQQMSNKWAEKMDKMHMQHDDDDAQSE